MKIITHSLTSRYLTVEGLPKEFFLSEKTEYHLHGAKLRPPKYAICCNTSKVADENNGMDNFVTAYLSKKALFETVKALLKPPFIPLSAEDTYDLGLIFLDTFCINGRGLWLLEGKSRLTKFQYILHNINPVHFENRCVSIIDNVLIKKFVYEVLIQNKCPLMPYILCEMQKQQIKYY